MGWHDFSFCCQESLEQLGAECLFTCPIILPMAMVPMLVSINTVRRKGISLVVTVDNGVTGHEAYWMAQSMGVDVVTDHHFHA